MMDGHRADYHRLLKEYYALIGPERWNKTVEEALSIEKKRMILADQMGKLLEGRTKEETKRNEMWAKETQQAWYLRRI